MEGHCEQFQNFESFSVYVERKKHMAHSSVGLFIRVLRNFEAQKKLLKVHKVPRIFKKQQSLRRNEVFRSALM